MKHFYFLLITLITISISAQNELANSSFETWTGTGSLDTPTDWYGSKSNIAKSATSQSSDAQDGASSVNLVNAGSSHKRFTNLAITSLEEEYTLTYYAKGDGELRNAYHDGEYSTYGDYNTLTSAGGWTQITYVFTPTAGDLEVIFSLRNTATEGILIDNVVLVKSSTISTNDNTLNKFSVYPNPVTNGYVNITSKSNEAIYVTVFDILGKQILSNSVNNNRLNVSKLTAGVYIMNMSQNGKITTKKLVIK